MNCCGSKRNNLKTQHPETAYSTSTPFSTQPVIIEYLGKNSNTVIGPVSKKTYSFTRQGQREMIDPMDVGGFEGRRKFLVVARH